jgi:hypothetical protein
MPPVFHYPPRQFDGVLDTLHGCHSAGCKCISFNDRCVHLHFAETIEGGSGAGVKERGVFENNHGGFSGIERRTTLFEYLPPGERSFLTTFQSLRQLFVADSPGTPVDNYRGPARYHIRLFVRGNESAN